MKTIEDHEQSSDDKKNDDLEEETNKDTTKSPKKTIFPICDIENARIFGSNEV